MGDVQAALQRIQKRFIVRSSITNSSLKPFLEATIHIPVIGLQLLRGILFVLSRTGCRLLTVDFSMKDKSLSVSINNRSF